MENNPSSTDKAPATSPPLTETPVPVQTHTGAVDAPSTSSTFARPPITGQMQMNPPTVNNAPSTSSSFARPPIAGQMQINPPSVPSTFSMLRRPQITEQMSLTEKLKGVCYSAIDICDQIKPSTYWLSVICDNNRLKEIIEEFTSSLNNLQTLVNGTVDQPQGVADVAQVVADVAVDQPQGVADVAVDQPDGHHEVAVVGEGRIRHVYHYVYRRRLGVRQVHIHNVYSRLRYRGGGRGGGRRGGRGGGGGVV